MSCLCVKLALYSNFRVSGTGLLLLVLLFSVLSAVAVHAQTDPYARARETMVAGQLMARDITHRATLQAMRTVPKHLYVPPDQKRNAYHDRPLPIGYGQTISQPYIVAYMTQTIMPARGQKVLEIGTGSGYQAAVLAEIVDQVYTIEIVGELGRSAKGVLDQHHAHSIRGRKPGIGKSKGSTTQFADMW